MQFCASCEHSSIGPCSDLLFYFQVIQDLPEVGGSASVASDAAHICHVLQPKVPVTAKTPPFPSYPFDLEPLHTTCLAHFDRPNFTCSIFLP